MAQIPKITVCEILKQIKNDLISKEVQTSPTYSYQWLACEVGHIGLGLMIFLAAVAFGHDGVIRGQYLLYVVGVAVLKEAGDIFLTAHEIKKRFDAKRDIREVRVDAFLAVLYMTLGGLFAYFARHCPLHGLSVLKWLVSWFVIALLPVVPSIRQKMYFQQADLPFLFRLPEFPATVLSKQAEQLVDQFFHSVGGATVRHLAIIGALESGKTSLAVGIGTEAAFKHRIVRYITFTKLREIGMGDEPPAPRNTAIWRWRESQLLVIDDVTGSNDGAGTPASLPAAVRSFANELANRCVIWVLDDATQQSSAWIDAIANATGLTAENIAQVTLASGADKRALAVDHITMFT